MADVVSELSRHFIERWGERCGGVPCVEGVNRILERSQKVRGQHVFWRIINGEFCQSTSPAVYWSHQDGIIIQVDQKRGTAVTVIVPKADIGSRKSVGWIPGLEVGNGRNATNNGASSRLPAGSKKKKRNR